MMDSQNQLIYYPVIWSRGNCERSLYSLVKMLNEDKILIPKFQREFCWELSKIKSWGETVIENDTVGVIVTYQINGDGPIYLADGLQRLRATQYLLNDTKILSRKVGHDQFMAYVDACQITIQHRHYDSHETALVAFQNLNKGTSATPYEFYKGDLTLNPIGEIIQIEVLKILESIERPFLRQGKSRISRQKLHRDAYILFYQYLSGTKRIDFRGSETPIEKEIVHYLINNNITQEFVIRDALSNFKDFLSNHVTALNSILINNELVGQSFSPTLFRNLIHWNIWRKNQKISATIFWKFTETLLISLRTLKDFPSRFPLPNSVPTESVCLNLATSKGLKQLSQALGVPFYDGQIRKKAKYAAPGYHESHITPFSKYGNGETFLEPAISNMIRGAKEVDS